MVAFQHPYYMLHLQISNNCLASNAAGCSKNNCDNFRACYKSLNCKFQLILFLIIDNLLLSPKTVNSNLKRELPKKTYFFTPSLS